MRTSVLFVFVLLLILPLPAQAQTDTWEDGCDARIIDVIAATTDVIDYHAGCARYRECDPSSYGYADCQFAAFQVMLEQCPLDDARCHDGAILFAAAILVFDDPFGESSGFMPPQEIIDAVPRGLDAFWKGDDAGALSAYQVPATSDTSYYAGDLMMPISRAVLYQRLNQPENAFAEYDMALDATFAHPLLAYARAQLYASLGRTDEASFDIATIGTFIARDSEGRVDDALNDFVMALQAQYPLDETVMQDWLLYPVLDVNGGVAGEFVSDNSLVPPRPVRLGIFDNLDVVVAIGLKNWSSDGFFTPDTILQVLLLDEAGTSYRLNYPEIYGNSGSIALVPDDFGFHGQERINFFEGAGDWRFMLAPVGAPDPRISLAEMRYCEGSVRSRLEIGAVVTDVSFLPEYALSFSETADGVIIEDSTSDRPFVTVLGGPECMDNVTWWQGHHNNLGRLGWFRENVDMTYTAAPSTIQAENILCDGVAPALPSRLAVDSTASVLPDLGSNNIRDYPSSEAELLGSIPPQGTFDIIGGPVCIDGLVWWHVDYNGLIGWTAEGADGIYWLAPTG
ncbi:MAG: hypothetical protein RLP44_27230 [Aggregatilineales bacterium]